MAQWQQRDLLAEAVGLVGGPRDPVIGVSIHIEDLRASVHFAQITLVFGGHRGHQIRGQQEEQRAKRSPHFDVHQIVD